MWQGRTVDGRLTAVKVLHAADDRPGRRRLVGQARRARAARHPRVLAPRAIATGPSEPATEWPWVPGRDLAGRLRRHGPPETTWGRALVAELDAVISALHDRGLVHGALTPEHILLDADGRPSLIGLDPVTRAGDEARAADLAAMTAIRGQLLTGGTDPDHGRGDAGGRRLPPVASRRRRLLPVAVGAAVMVTGAIGASVRAAPGPVCPSQAQAPGHRADVDGDGCDDRLEWSTETGRLSAETVSGSRAWDLGRPGDRFLLGDWNCDGTLTPGLHRPATGRSYRFDTWPDEHPVTAEPVDAVRPCPIEP